MSDEKEVKATPIDEIPDDDLVGVYAEAVAECTTADDDVLLVYFDVDCLSGFNAEYPEDCVVVNKGPAVILRFKTLDDAVAYCNVIAALGVTDVTLIRGSVIDFMARKFNVFVVDGVQRMMPV